MKNLFIATALLLSITAGAGAQTADNEPAKVMATVSVCEKNPQKVTVTITNPAAEKLTIDVYSTEHGYLMSKTTKVNDYRANLDFSTAADGEYTIRVSCRGKERYSKTVAIGTHETTTRELTLAK
ncbi:MAG: hypothetical protein V4539_10215 [Bacteroidota bacterium]